MINARLALSRWSTEQIEECIICIFVRMVKDITKRRMRGVEEIIVSSVSTVHSDKLQSRIWLDAKFFFCKKNSKNVVISKLDEGLLHSLQM